MLPIGIYLIGKFIIGFKTTAGDIVLTCFYLSLIVLVIHLIKELKGAFYIYIIILVLNLVPVIGALLAIWHLPGYGQASVLGLVGSVLAGFVLVWNAVQNRRKEVKPFHLALGIVILIQVLIPFNLEQSYLHYAGLLNYPIAGLAATILINRSYTSTGERSILLLILVQSIIYVLRNFL